MSLLVALKPIGLQKRRAALPGALAVLAFLGACASPSHRAPVEERKPPPPRVSTAGSATATPGPAQTPSASPTAAETPAPRPTGPGAENAGRPGFYTVRPGDTLIRIALDNGQNWRDVARWNNITNPNLIEVGQVLRVVLPPVETVVASTRPVTTAGAVETRPLEPRAAGAAATGATTGVAAPTVPPTGTGAVMPAVTPGAAPPPSTPSGTPTAAPVTTAPASGVPVPARDNDDEVNWAWPAAGPVASGFDEAKSKGLAITGRAGDPVLAAADGRVVYAGSGLRGYGNLIIVKHNAAYLTAYAHNQTLLVKEDQAVRRGQKIAEMGNTDAERVQLHFEIRRQGKPIDPARLLPPR
jgi:lipoprotein NlpD